jgi:glycerol-3-phosphate acyltransferase PlsY
MLNLLFVMVISYFIGSIPTSILAGKLLRGIDIRQHGSGNAGATNVFRVLGWKPGIFVMAFDIFKGFAAAYWIARLFSGNQPVEFELIQLLAGFSAVAGHVWTIFAGFRGGKGVGTAAGMLLALQPSALLICLLVFTLVFLLSRIVSLSSMSAALAFPVTLTIFKYTLNRPVALSLYVFSFFAAVFILYTHRTNIKRLLQGKENKFGRKKA